MHLFVESHRSSFRYLLSTSLTSQEESFQKSFEWTKFDNRRQDILSEGKSEIFLNTLLLGGVLLHGNLIFSRF